MTRSALLPAALIIALLSGAGSAPAQPQAPSAAAARSPGIERFMKIRTPGAPTIAPDGTLYVRDWPDGVFQLYRVEGDVARPDSKMTALTSFPDGLAGYSMSEDGRHILLLHATGGNENNQISRLDPKTGKITPLLSDPKVQHSVNTWLPDNSGFIYTANDQSPNDFYVYRYDFGKDGGPGKSTKLMGNAGAWYAADVSRSGERALVGQFRSSSDSTLHELNTRTGALNELTPKAADAPTVSVEPVGYMPGEAAVLYTSDHEGGLRRLFLRELKTGAVSKPVSELESFEIDNAAMNQEKSVLAVITNEDGYGVLHAYRLPGFEKITLPNIEKGVVSLSSLRGNRITWGLSNARTPGLAYTYEIPDDGVNVGRQITFADTQGIDLSAFPLPELVKYQSFDGTTIPAFVYLPAGYRKGTPIPFIVNYHGGPEGQFRPGFDRTSQYLLSEGFGVMQPNVRGSAGYGRGFLMMDDYKKRWDSVRDGVEAAAWLVENGYSAPGKMATMGGSYGGFMSVACIVEDQERVDAGTQKERLFGAGINVVGIVNLRTFLEQTSGYRRKLREAEYGPLSDPEFLESISSIRRADKINVPMYIAHGFNDPRVPVGEAMQLAAALKDKAFRDKIPANNPHLFIAPDEGHGFAKLNNRLYHAQYMAAFLKQTIGR